MKTASSSMEIALSEFLGDDDIITPARQDLATQRKSGFQGQNYRLDHPDVPRIALWRKLLRRPERYYHSTVGFYEHMPAWRVRRYLGEDIWSSGYKFAFERNPWDRQVSFYHYKTRKMSRSNMPSFQKFLAKGKRVQVSNWTNYTIDDEIALDFVGRFENLDEDFKQALEAIGLEGQVSLPRSNSGELRRNNTCYRSYYNARTRDIVAEWSAGEIAHFGYEF